MNKISTRDRILDAALTLFAEKGYDGVGVDLIAANAGVKGPSIYKHFKGKEDILRSLIEKGECYYEMKFGSENHPGNLPASMEELVNLSMERIRFTLHDPMIRKIRRILAMEQFRSPRIAELATKHSIYGIQSMYQKIFRDMMAAGTLRQDDPALLAMSFSAPVTLYIQMCDRQPQREQEAMEQIEAHLRHFAAIYGG